MALMFPATSLAVTLIPLPGVIQNAPINIFDPIFSILWPLFAGFSVIMFIVAAFMFLTANGEPGKILLARNAMIWASVGVGVGLLSFSIPFMVKFALNV